jgi:hypothetical protein
MMTPAMSRPLVVVLFTLAALAAAPAGCSRRAAPRKPAPSPATAPAPAGSSAAERFSRPDLGVELTLPGGWRQRPSADYVLLLHAPGASDPSLASLSLDVPDLPFHLPGMIPIGPVRSGYLDDLRKQVGPLTTEDLPPPDVGGAAARRVRSTWHAGAGAEFQETALLLVHGDRVYILRARTDPAHEAETQAAFDSVVRSIRWIK